MIKSCKSTKLAILISFAFILSCKNNPTGVPHLERKEFTLTGTITATFSGNPIPNADISAEIIDGESKDYTISNSNGKYTLNLFYYRDKSNPKSIFVSIKAKGPNIRFIRETGFQAANIEGIIEFNFDCIENYGDGLSFNLPLYNKLNLNPKGITDPTYRWYPKFPDVYVVRTPNISNKQYQLVINGIKKISAVSRGKIPPLNIYTVNNADNIHHSIMHEWIDDNTIPNYCGVTYISAENNSINKANTKYKIKKESCSGSSFHEMMHAMMIWHGLDLLNKNEINEYQLSLQIAFHYSRYPKHTFTDNIDKDMKPYL